ncbi:MAG: hypothetical protein ACTJLL_00380 [Anaplasma sp.]
MAGECCGASGQEGRVLLVSEQVRTCLPSKGGISPSLPEAQVAALPAETVRIAVPMPGAKSYEG